MEMNNNANSYLSSDFSHPSTSTFQTTHRNPTKKRTKFISSGVVISNSKPVTRKPPNPTASKITRPCTECGKKFWSWKALFGHMRCHPERQWRGINPPPNFRPRLEISEEDSEVAACLLMLANGPPAAGAASDLESPSVTTTVNQLGMPEQCYCLDSGGMNNYRFECSSCKKVFGSHQALGGHRASHKNVKGCYAITKKDGDHHEIDRDDEHNGDHDDGHKSGIRLSVFSSGQALGGHMRCHWEQVEEPSMASRAFDLNLPAPLQDGGDDDASAVYSSAVSHNLDLRLGL